MGRACSTHGEKKRAFKRLLGRPGGKRPLGRHRRRWEDNIPMDLAELEWGCVDWIQLP
jgi:hypothetical protein